jgi:peroxiredoxin
MKLKVFALAASLCLAFSVAAFAEDAPKVEIKYGQAVGDNIRPVVLKAVDGSSSVEVAKLEKKTLFLMISSVCTACRKEVQEVGENVDKFKERGIDIYGVIIDMEPADAAKRIGTVPFPLLGDADQKMGDATNLLSTPSTIIVKGGKILYTKAGYRSGQWREYVAEEKK